MTTLEEKLITSSTWLDRYNPSVLAEIDTKLKIAQEQIIPLVNSTTNKTLIRKELNKIMQEAFSTFDTVLLNDDIPEIQEIAWNATNAIMATYTTEKGVKYVSAKKTITDRLKSPSVLIQGYTIDEHFKDLSYKTTRKIRGQIYNGFDNGLSTQEINRNIRNTIGNVNRNQANTIAKTSIFEATENARNSLYENYFDDVIEGYLYDTTIDNRRSDYCTVAHAYFTKDLKSAKYRPKSHYNCRSLWIPKVKDIALNQDEQLLTEFDSKEVNHRDGTNSTKFKINNTKNIPADIKGINTLKYFDDKYLRDYLGTTRYNLYNSGEASLKDMFNISKGKLLSVDDLKKRLSI